MCECRQDVSLFEGIISDLFPGVELPQPDYGVFLDAIKASIAKRRLQPVPWFIEKIIQVAARAPHTRGGICVPPTVTYLPYRVSGSTLTAVGRSQLLARRPGTHTRILSGIQRAVQTVLGVYLKRTCSRVTSASSALGVLNDYAIYKSKHSLTHFLSVAVSTVECQCSREAALFHV